MVMPAQKPGRSKQDYTTPPELLEAIKSRLRIEKFAIDLAASKENTVAEIFYTEEDDSLRPGLKWDWGSWAWLNPPFGNIDPWVRKAVTESAVGAHIVMLVPASVGTNWWLESVSNFTYQVFLNGRITFGGTPINPKTGKPDPYPKDCALLFYTPWGFRGSEIWRWADDVPKLQQPEFSED